MDRSSADLYKTRSMVLLHRTEFPENHHYVPDPDWTRAAFTIMRAGEAVTAPDYRVTRDAYPGQDVLFCRAGRGFARSEGAVMRVGPEQLVWIANEAPHAHWPDASDPWTVLWVRLAGPDCAAMRRKIFGAGPTLLTLARPEQIELWFSRLFRVLRARAPDIDLALNHLVGEFLHLLATRAARPDQTLLPEKLRAALAAMRRAPERAWPASAVAAAGGSSAAHMRRLFQRHLGLSPHRWLIRERIMLSQRLLWEPDATVGAVAERCGFCDVYHFSRTFRRVVGISPGAWRQAEGAGARSAVRRASAPPPGRDRSGR